MSSPAEFVEIAVNKDFFYSSVPQGIRFGPAEAGNSYMLEKLDAIFTTGTSVSMVPSSVAEIFFKKTLEGLSSDDWFLDNGIYKMSCATKIPDVYIMFEEHWIQIKGTDMLTDISLNNDNTSCMLNFIPSVDDYWVLGTAIFKNYYVYHNSERGVMGWVPTTQRFKAALEPAAPPQTPFIEVYNVEFAYTKLGVAFGVWVATVLIAQFVFSTSFSGVGFLNAASIKAKKTTITKKQ